MHLKNSDPISRRTLVFGVCVFLAAMVWLVFGQTLGHGFVNYDDNTYVYENQEVLNGLTRKGIAWAFTHSVNSNWHPLTMLSYMLDHQLYGLNPGGYHLTNIQLHTVAVILLFLVLENMTGAIWRSAFVAALFAIHPLHVESVAWVSERKDVLSGVFFMLTLGAYVRYARAPRSLGRYLLVMFLFALGLMSKPMLVTLPFVLLLLDYWPLGRMDLGFGKLILEKVPLLALSALACGVALLTQKESMAEFPLSLRLGNALASCAIYLGQMIYPAGLAMPYPFPREGVPLWKIAGAVLLLAVFSGVAFAWRRERPYVLTGWLWYLGMLVPVIGIVQVGSQARADRYTYLPQIGISLLATWMVADISVSWPRRRLALGCCSAIVLASLGLCAHRQTAWWRDSQTLWNRALACTERNGVAHSNLATALLENGRAEEGIAHYQKALEIDPGNADAHDNLGNALLQTNRVNEAIAHYQKALEIQPGNADAHNNLGNALQLTNRVEEAIPHYRRALEIRPDFASAHANLGRGLLRNGQVDEAISHYERALELQPGNPGFQNALAWVLATCPKAASRNGAKAVELARQAYRLTGDDPAILRTLAAAYAQAGRFPEAVEAARRALELTEPKNTALAGAIRREIGLYEAGCPYKDATEK